MGSEMCIRDSNHVVLRKLSGVQYPVGDAVIGQKMLTQRFSRAGAVSRDSHSLMKIFFKAKCDWINRFR